MVCIMTLQYEQCDNVKPLPVGRRLANEKNCTANNGHQGCYSRTLVARTIRPARLSKRDRLYINSRLYTVFLLIA